MSSVALRLRGITRRFGAVLANDAVDLEVAAGSIHAVIGENGAGKSTLLRIAYGMERADAGSLEVCGHALPLAGHTPRRALAAGLGMVHQHFMLVPTLSVLENSMLGRERSARGVLELGAARAELAAASSRYGLEVDPDALVETLSVGERQRVEILRVILGEAKVIILDEPTAVLTPREIERLFSTLRGLAADGHALVIVTHKLDEVLALADQVTVLRQGRGVLAAEVAKVSADELVAAMIGRPPRAVARSGPGPAEDERLVVGELVVAGPGRRRSVAGVSFVVRGGEIVGIAGVEGNGQSELEDAIAGLRPIRKGTVTLNGHDLAGATVARRFELGLSHIPEDRHQRGLLLDAPISASGALGRAPAWARRGLLSAQRVRQECVSIMESFDVRPRDPELPTRHFSGGNQQKLIVGRELSRPGASVLLACQPTRGVDVAAIELIHQRLLAARDRGWAVLLISSDLGEHLALADRILVMRRGRIVGEAAGAEREREDLPLLLGAWMTGAEASGRAEADAATGPEVG